MKRLSVLHWLAAAALAASLPVTARALSGHGMGGFAGGGPRAPGTRLTLLTMGITPLTMATPTILPILAADRISITSIGLIWPRRCNRSLPGAAITTDRLTG